MSSRKLRACEVCSVTYRPTYGAQRTCGRVCGERLRREITGTLPSCRPHSKIRGWCKVYIRNCDQCGKLFVGRSLTTRRCGTACSYSALLALVHAHHAHGIGATIAEQELITLPYLVKRDRGRCGICHKSVRAKTGPMRASIDHIVPLSRGGTHELINVQLAHLRCNQSKNNRGSGEQLLLVG